MTADLHLFDETGQIFAEVVGLHIKRARREVLVQAMQNQPHNYLYELEWQPKERQLELLCDVPNQTIQPSLWLIFADRGGVGLALKQQLCERGQSVVTVLLGEAYEYSSETGDYKIDPNKPEDLQQLLKEVMSSQGSCRGIVYLWNLEEPSLPETTLATIESSQRLGCGSILHLIQGLVNNKLSKLPRLWLVTQNTQPVDLQTGSLNVAQSPLWGLGRVLALEHPELWGGIIDLDDSPAEEKAMRLLAEVWEPQGEDQLAFRNEQRYVARLVPCQHLEAQPVQLLSNGIYLITGGLGVIGLETARWMVEQGAQHLVLLGRTSLPERATWNSLSFEKETERRIAAILELELLGATVEVVAADVSDWKQISGVFAQLQRSELPLRGVIHAAGISPFQPIDKMDNKALQSVLKPKMLGAWVLHELTKEMNLDFFVLFSSAASIWGSKGLAHYAAANHFLDTLAHHRQALSLPALSVNWARLSKRGMVSPEEEKMLAKIGLKSVPIEQALGALGRLINEGVPQKTVAAVDWTIFKETYNTKIVRPFLEQIELPQQVKDKQPSVSKSDILRQLEEALSGQRQELLVAYLQREIAQVLGFAPSRPLDPKQGVFEMGMDSLMAVELKSQLEESLTLSLPSTLTFEYPNIEALAGYLSRQLFPDESSPKSNQELSNNHNQEQSPPAEVQNLEQLSEDELVALLADELN